MTIAVLAAAVSLNAEAPERSILFVGNSFTFGGEVEQVIHYRSGSVADLNGDGVGGVPALFKRLTEEAGLDFRVSLETSPGQTLGWHLANKSATLDRPWNFVVLQQYSTLNPDKPGDAAETIVAARALTGLLVKRNPRVDISLVATWTRPDLTVPPEKHWSGQPITQMALDIRKADDEVRNLVPAIARIVPVGQAFNCAVALGIADPNPYDGIDAGKIDLWAGDHYHASAVGYYLEALTDYAAVTRRDPRKFGASEAVASDLDIAPSIAVKLQRIAYAMATGGRCAAD